MTTSSHHTRGMLDPNAGATRFSLSGRPPIPELAPFIAAHWVAEWNLTAPYPQAMLPCPSTYLVIGTSNQGVYGVTTSRIVAVLDGEGWAVGTRFRAGNFRAFAPRWKMQDLVDRVLRLDEAFGAAGAELAARVHVAAAPERIGLVEAFLLARAPKRERAPLLVARAVEHAQNSPELTRVDELALAVGVSVRVLERLFRTYVGIGPKAALRRFRLQEAAERAASGHDVDWAKLAHDCGYFDQAHMIREFKAQIGETPKRYASRQEAPAE